MKSQKVVHPVKIKEKLPKCIMSALLQWCGGQQAAIVMSYTVDARYLDLAYLELPLISKWNSGPCFNMEI